MAITDLLPWTKNDRKLPARRNTSDSPNDALFELHERMNSLFDDFFRSSFSPSPWTDVPEFGLSAFYPSVDVQETGHEIKVVVELPGMDEKDIDLSLQNGGLVISGEKKSEKEEKDQRYYRSERTYGSFRRVIPLPDEVDENQCEAVFKNGVLTVTLTKPDVSTSKAKRIQVRKT